MTLLHRSTARWCLLAVTSALVLSGSSCEDDNAARDEWVLSWQDEFDGPAGQLPDPTKWQFDVGTGWGNNQLEYDTSRATNVSLDGGGHLAITAREEQFGGAAYTSGRIKTQDLFDQTYGKFEARIRLPIGRGIWPAFWLLGDNITSVGWPECGEIDIMEYRGQAPRTVAGSLHGPGYSGANPVTNTYQLQGEDFDQAFHVFSVEWETDRILWKVDGVPYSLASKRELPAGGRWVFDHPFFLILNVAVGGNYVGPPDASTNFPQRMLVDWVRVYRRGG